MPVSADPVAPEPAPPNPRLPDALRGAGAETDPFVAAVRAIRAPLVITDPRQPDNPIIFANDAFCHLTGYTFGEILGRNCRFLQAPATDPATVRRIRDAVATAQPVEIEIRNRRRNGELFWNRLLIAPVLDTGGNPAYFVASQTDVSPDQAVRTGLETDNAALLGALTERLRTQQAREREIAFAMRAGRFGAWSIEFAGMELAASDSCRELFGLPAGQPFTYHDRLAAVLPEDRPMVEAALQRSLHHQADYDETYRIVRPDGQVRWLTSRGQTFTDPGGHPVRLTGVSQDVTAERRAERMRSALVELSDILRTQDDPDRISFAVAQLIGTTLDVSRAGYGLVDHAAETITIACDWNAPGIQSLAGTLRFRDFGSYIEDLKRGHTVIIANVRHDPRTAATVHALEANSARALVNMPLTEQEGLVALLYLNHAEARDWPEDELSFIRDVAERTRDATERRRAEKALATLAASLETEVQDRTRELLAVEAALRQSQKMEAVGQLTGGLAHDFNNLLTGVTGSLELMQTRIAQGRVNELERYVTAAQGAARRATALTHRLLAFSRRQTLDPRPTDVNRLVAGMEELIGRTVGMGITVEPMVAAAGLWPTLVDPGQLENALLNLCINARDAMPDGGKITIETGNRRLDARAAHDRDLEPGQYVFLSVSDTGTGMPPEVVAKAFDPFFTTKPIGQGTGLGLSMIYGFAKQSGGQACICSEPGQGTTVSLYLPRHVGEAQAPELPPELAGAARAEQGETVLVVDDEPTVRMLVAEVLGELGYTAVEAADGAAGLRVLQSDTRIDLLVTDVGLPNGFNGRQLADAARTTRPTLKVLFITGYAENAVLSHGHLAPGMHVLPKPFSIDSLATRIKTMISG